MPADPTRTAPAAAPADTADSQPTGGPAAAGPVPARIGPYEVVRPLGKGGMGAVYECREPDLKRAVAVKVMLPGFAADPRHKARFVREAQAQARVEHDHVMPIYRVGEADGAPFLAMPLLKGGTLADYLRRGVPPVGEAVRIAREMADGLAAAHAAGLIHRDIKPGNVALDGPRRRVKLLDFGLARPVRPDAEADLTGTGAVLGTPAYMAPEQARGLPVDHRADLFSLGVVLYELLTGRRPFVGSDVLSVLSALALDQPEPPAVANPQVPAELSELTMRLLAKAPADRPPTAEAVAAELAAVERRLTGVQVVPVAAESLAFADLGSPSAVAVTAVPVRRGPPWGWIGLGLAVLAAAGLLAAQVARVTTPKGTLVVECDDPAVEVVVKKDGAVLLDKTRQREIVLAVGEYGIELAENKDGLKLTTDKFEIVRDGKATVRVRVEKPKPAEPAKLPAEPPTTPPPASAAGRDDRPAVLALGSVWDRVVRTAAGENVTVKKGQRPPDGPLVLLELDDNTSDPKSYPSGHIRDVLTPNVRACAELQKVHGYLQSLAATEEDAIALLDAAPPRLYHLGGVRLPLTKPVISALRRYKSRRTASVGPWLTISADTADDALLTELADVGRVEVLWLRNLPAEPRVTPAGLAALGKLNCSSVGLHTAGRLSARSLRALIDGPRLRILNVIFSDLTDDSLEGLGDGGGLINLNLRGTRLTDAAVQSLLRLTKLKVLTIGVEFSAAAAQRLADGLPECEVVRDGQRVPVTQPPPAAPPAPIPPQATDPPKPRPANTRDDRPAILKLHPHWDVTVRTDAGDRVTVKVGEPLPAGKLVLTGLYCGSTTNRFPPGYVGEVFLPAVRQCPDLTGIDALNSYNSLSEAEALTLFGGAARGLTDLGGVYLPLTNGVIEGVRRYKGTVKPPVLTTLAFNGQYDDVLLTRLATLPGIDVLWLGNLGDGVRLTGKGLEAVGKMSLTFLGLPRSKGMTADFLRKVSAGKKLQGINLCWTDLDEAALAGLADSPAGTVRLYQTNLTDTAVPHLLKLTNARRLDLNDTRITEAGARRLAAGLPDCRVDWGGKVVTAGP